MKDVQHVGETKLNCCWHCYQSFRICLYVRIILMKLYCDAMKVSTLVPAGKKKVSTQDSCVLPRDYLVTTFHQIQMKLPWLMHLNGSQISANIHITTEDKVVRRCTKKEKNIIDRCCSQAWLHFLGTVFIAWQLVSPSSVAKKEVYEGHHNPIILCSSTKIERTIPVCKDIQSV